MISGRPQSSDNGTLSNSVLISLMQSIKFTLPSPLVHLAVVLLSFLSTNPAYAVDQSTSTEQQDTAPIRLQQLRPQIAASASPASDKDLLDKQHKPIEERQLTPNALQLAQMLHIVDVMEELKAKSSASTKSRDDLIDLMLLREKLSRAIQYAALELEEALANIEADLGIANMQYAFFSAKHDRAVMLNNIAAFTSSGGLGALSNSTSFTGANITPNVLGATGNALAVAIPMLGLLPPKYKVPKHSTEDKSGNVLAPIFGREYSGPGYDPIVWDYLKAVPADSKTNETRIQTLLKNWQSYRGLGNKDGKSKETIDMLIGVSPPEKKLSLEILKTRAELLVELQALVQQMYKDISDLNTSIMAIE